MGERESYLPFGRLTAASFWVAWITVVFSGDIVVTASLNAYETTTLILLGATFGMGFAMVAGACFPKTTWRIITSAKAMGVIGAICSLTTCIMGYEAFVAPPLFACTTLLSGMTLSFLVLRCAIVFAETTTRTAAIFTGACGLSGVLIYALFSMAAQFHSPFQILIMSALLPIFGTITSFLERDSLETELLRDEATERLTPSFWRVVAFMAIISFTLSVVRGFYPRLIDPIQFASSRADAAILLALCFVLFLSVVTTRKNEYAFGSLFYWLFIIAVAIMVPVVMLGSFSSYSGSLATVSKGVLFLAAWNFLSLWSYKTGMSAVRVFGFGFGSTMIAAFVGYTTGNLAGAVISTSYGTVFESAVLLICVILAMFLLRIRDLQGVLTPSLEMMKSLDFGNNTNTDVFYNTLSVSRETEVSSEQALDLEEDTRKHVEEIKADSEPPQLSESTPEKSIDNKPGRFKLRCNLIAEEFGLTPREADVFFLLAKHLEVKAIADELCVSFNTARTHVRHIYAKLEVHNRRELDELIDTYDMSQ